MSKVRKSYVTHFIGRCMILALCAGICVMMPQQFEVLEGWNFFKKPSAFHILWLLWMFDMLSQLFPLNEGISIGSRKVFSKFYKPAALKVQSEKMQEHIHDEDKAASRVFVLWTIVTVVLGILYSKNYLNDTGMLMVTVFFYVCDLFCVIIWCPFRMLMGNRCCTTCRIFNWDHLMMFVPMIFVKGFFSYSLFIMSVIVWIKWEANVRKHPEQFWEKTNTALSCSNCTDKLCTQYCGKKEKSTGHKIA